MNVLSLFDGISCGQVALKRAGIQVDNYFSSEIELNSMKVTRNNFPNTKFLGDVCRINPIELPPIDLLLAGSPCQSFSRAISDNSGLAGKSKLFYEFVRLLRETKPKYFLLENVLMKKEWVDVITKEVGVEPIQINSKLFSAQSRERLYWTNIPIAELPSESPLMMEDILENSFNVPHKYWYHESFERHHDKKSVIATLNIKGHDILKRVYAKDGKSPTLTAVCGGNQHAKVLSTYWNKDMNERVRKLMPVEYERLQTLPDNYTDGISDSGRYKAIGNGWTVDVIAHILKGIKI